MALLHTRGTRRPSRLRLGRLPRWQRIRQRRRIPGSHQPPRPRNAPVLDTFCIPDGSGSACLEVRLTQDLRALDGTVTSETSTDGTTWESTRNDQATTRIVEISIDHAAGTRVLAFQATTSLTDSPRQFLRLVFTSP